MHVLKHHSLIIGLFLIINASANAEGFIKKEVYSYKDKSGNIVFTDRQPVNKKAFKTRTIEAANSTGNLIENSQVSYKQQSYSQQQIDHQTYANNTVGQPQTVRIIVEEGGVSKKKQYKKKRSLKRCKSYKKKLNYYSDKMKAGYKSSEYKKLEYQRKKYKNLLFNNCETKTFSD